MAAFLRKKKTAEGPEQRSGPVSAPASLAGAAAAAAGSSAPHSTAEGGTQLSQGPPCTPAQPAGPQPARARLDTSASQQAPAQGRGRARSSAAGTGGRRGKGGKPASAPSRITELLARAAARPAPLQSSQGAAEAGGSRPEASGAAELSAGERAVHSVLQSGQVAGQVVPAAAAAEGEVSGDSALLADTSWLRRPAGQQSVLLCLVGRCASIACAAMHALHAAQHRKITYELRLSCKCKSVKPCPGREASYRPGSVCSWLCAAAHAGHAAMDRDAGGRRPPAAEVSPSKKPRTPAKNQPGIARPAADPARAASLPAGAVQLLDSPQAAEADSPELVGSQPLRQSPLHLSVLTPPEHSSTQLLHGSPVLMVGPSSTAVSEQPAESPQTQCLPGRTGMSSGLQHSSRRGQGVVSQHQGSQSVHDVLTPSQGMCTQQIDLTDS